MLYDVAIIGAGPGGSNAAEYAAVNGLSVVIFEKNSVGGVCLNEGCIPTKTLLNSAKIYDKIRDGKKYAVTANDIEIDMGKLIARKTKIIKKLAAGIKMGFREKGIELVEGNAVFTQKDENGNYVVSCNENTYTSKKLILATGSESVVPSIKGISETEIWTSREALNNKEIPETLTVIGGGVIGMEFVSFFTSLGTKVTVVEMMPKILGETDEEISEMLMADFKKKGVTFYMNTKVTEVNSTTVFAENEDGKIEIPSEKILLSVGRRPVLNDFGLENLNLEHFRSGLKVNEHMQTSDPNVYAVGDITGFSLLAHTASREGQAAVNHILNHPDKMHYNAIPSVVYTHPEIGSIGKTEKQLDAEGIKYSVKKVPMAFSGRFVIENEMGNGICKIILNENKEIIGGHIYGDPASEIIVNVGIAIEQKMTVDQFRKLVFPHPTVSEIVNLALF